MLWILGQLVDYMELISKKSEMMFSEGLFLAPFSSFSPTIYSFIQDSMWTLFRIPVWPISWKRKRRTIRKKLWSLDQWKENSNSLTKKVDFLLFTFLLLCESGIEPFCLMLFVHRSLRLGRGYCTFGRRYLLCKTCPKGVRERGRVFNPHQNGSSEDVFR